MAYLLKVVDKLHLKHFRNVWFRAPTTRAAKQLLKLTMESIHTDRVALLKGDAVKAQCLTVPEMPFRAPWVAWMTMGEVRKELGEEKKMVKS